MVLWPKSPAAGRRSDGNVEGNSTRPQKMLWACGGRLFLSLTGPSRSSKPPARSSRPPWDHSPADAEIATP